MINRCTHLLIAVAVMIMMGGVAAAENDNEASSEFKTAQQKESYHALINELRCLVCQNQTIAESGADLAKDMRAVVRTMLNEGHDEAAIVAVMVERYGDFVRYQPPFDHRTALLWLAPFLLVMVGLLWLPRVFRQQKAVRLSAAESAAAESLLKANNDDKNE